MHAEIGTNVVDYIGGGGKLDTPISINFPPKKSFHVKSPLWKCGYLLLHIIHLMREGKGKNMLSESRANTFSVLTPIPVC